MKKLIGLSTALGLVLAGLFSGGASADAKNYNGSNCLAFAGDGKRFSYSNIYNTSSTTNLRVDCLGTKDAGSIKNAYIEVRDLSSAEDVSCTLVSHYNEIGKTGGRLWSQNKKTSGINSNWVRLSYSGLGAAANGHYYFGCSVPKRTSNGASWIGTYQINEKN